MIASRGSSPWFASLGSANSATLETQHAIDAATDSDAFSLRQRSESSMPPKRIVLLLLLLLLLSAAVLVLVLVIVLVIVIDLTDQFSALDSATPSKDDRRQVFHGRTIALSLRFVPITSTSTVATRLSTSTTCDRQNGSDKPSSEYQTTH